MSTFMFEPTSINPNTPRRAIVLTRLYPKEECFQNIWASESFASF